MRAAARLRRRSASSQSGRFVPSRARGRKQRRACAPAVDNLALLLLLLLPLLLLELDVPGSSLLFSTLLCTLLLLVNKAVTRNSRDGLDSYHNIAVEQLLLSRVHEACVSSQNARRLAKLSLSYSNRWVPRACIDLIWSDRTGSDRILHNSVSASCLCSPHNHPHHRWLSRFEGTHQAALNALSMSLEVRKKLTNKTQADLFKNLTSALFS